MSARDDTHTFPSMDEDPMYIAAEGVGGIGLIFLEGGSLIAFVMGGAGELVRMFENF